MSVLVCIITPTWRHFVAKKDTGMQLDNVGWFKRVLFFILLFFYLFIYFALLR